MINNLEDLYYDQLRDLYSAETQLVAAMPEMINQVSNPELRDVFNEHLEETRKHVDRLGRICTEHGIDPTGEDCDAMRGLVKEARKHLAETSPGDVRDAAIIASANRVDHYEIAAYGVAKAFAEALGFNHAANLLEDALAEEAHADKTITKIAVGGLFFAKGLNEDAIH